MRRNKQETKKTRGASQAKAGNKTEGGMPYKKFYMQFGKFHLAIQ
jgi:hypothetical protein